MGDSVKIYSKVTPHLYEKENVLINVEKYDFSKDSRLLIPFVNTRGKIGFRDRRNEIVCHPAFDSIFGSCDNEQDVVIVGRLQPVGFTRANDEIAIYEHLKFGVVDSTGKLLLETNYNRIYTNRECSSFVICKGTKYGAVDRNGTEIIPLGRLERNSCLKKALNGKYWGADEYGHYKLPSTYTEIEFEL